MPWNSTPTWGLAGARAALARAIGAARPTNRSGSGGNQDIGVSRTSKLAGDPGGAASDSSVARAPNRAGVAIDRAGAPPAWQVPATAGRAR